LHLITLSGARARTHTHKYTHTRYGSCGRGIGPSHRPLPQSTKSSNRQTSIACRDSNRNLRERPAADLHERTLESFYLLSRPINAQHIFLNNILCIVMIPTCFNVTAQSSGSLNLPTHRKHQHWTVQSVHAATKQLPRFINIL